MRDEGVLAVTPFQIEKMVTAGRQVIYAPDEIVFKEAGTPLIPKSSPIVRSDHPPLQRSVTSLTEVQPRLS
ncbi:MAG: hypothetical protein U0223_19020 [Nitrospira sp.]|nr:hypothetical protein [Nitrospira sp.]